MLDRLFAPALTFLTLIAGTFGFAIALTSMTSPDEAPLAQTSTPQVIHFERVEIVGRRDAPAVKVADKEPDSKPATAEKG